MNPNQPPPNERDYDAKYKWKIFIPAPGGWPKGMSRAFKIKAKFDVWLTENNIRGITFYNNLYLTRDKDVVYFKLSWQGDSDYQVVKLR
jgi:hypothetical protein